MKYSDSFTFLNPWLALSLRIRDVSYSIIGLEADYGA
jgi:hypothetical protein